jgi:hypothetical protein
MLMNGIIFLLREVKNIKIRGTSLQYLSTYANMKSTWNRCTVKAQGIQILKDHKYWTHDENLLTF